jgi:hypothetical protein
LRFLGHDNRALIGKDIQRRHYPMPTKDNFSTDYSLALFPVDEPEQQVIGKLGTELLSRRAVLAAGIVVATAIAIGVAILSVGNPVKLFADVTASQVDKSALQPGTDQSIPTIQSTADAQVLPPTAKDAPIRDEIAAASEPAGQGQTEDSEPPSESLFRQFQAWAAENDAQAQIGPVQPNQGAPPQVVHDAPAQVAESALGPLWSKQKYRHVQPAHNARAEIRPAENPRKKVRREKNAGVQVSPARDARAQD